MFFTDISPEEVKVPATPGSLGFTDQVSNRVAIAVEPLATVLNFSVAGPDRPSRTLSAYQGFTGGDGSTGPIARSHVNKGNACISIRCMGFLCRKCLHMSRMFSSFSSFSSFTLFTRFSSLALTIAVSIVKLENLDNTCFLCGKLIRGRDLPDLGQNLGKKPAWGPKHLCFRFPRKIKKN